uniref:Uncharacterized protein n=1 Tax=Anguilla anguilla TaxID=7936 RepID=A0A0E9T794_ANGAN
MNSKKCSQSFLTHEINKVLHKLDTSNITGISSVVSSMLKI